jgi:hypothetical protein
MSSRIARVSGRSAVVALLVFCLGFEVVKHHAYLAAVVGLALPDVIARLATGRDRLTGVTAAARSYWAPVALMVASVPDVVPLAFFVVGLAWSLRLAVGRLAALSAPVAA